MAVYVDDANIPADVPNGARVHRSKWSHLTADTQEELHEFAALLGLKRSYFQPGRPLGGKPSPFWHYDVTAGKRAQAIRLGARPTPWREMPAICRARDAALAAAGQHEGARLPARAAELDCQAGEAFRAGDHAGALTLLDDARATCPDMAPMLTEHARRVLAAVPREPAPARPGKCPGCQTAELAYGRERCQACGALEAMAAAPQRTAEYRDLSHGQPGHMCVLPGAEREAEAGS